MSSSTFQVVYDGPALEGSAIDVRDLAPALLALGQVLEEANNTFNDGHAKVTLKVNASFKSGCFGIDFSVIQGILDQAIGLFRHETVASAKELLDLLGISVADVAKGVAGTGAVGLIGLIKWLRDRPIRKVVVLEGERVRIMVDDDELEVERRTIELLRNHRLRVALEKAILEPLEREGFESVSFTTDPKMGAEVVSRSERAWFSAPPPAQESLDDRTDEVRLQLVNVSFREDNKWRFSDGGAPFFATVSDDGFLQRVKSSEETFAAGDILRVRMRRRQWLEGETMKVDYEVLKVLEHRKGAAQLPINFAPPESEW